VARIPVARSSHPTSHPLTHATSHGVGSGRGTGQPVPFAAALGYRIPGVKPNRPSMSRAYGVSHEELALVRAQKDAQHLGG